MPIIRIDPDEQKKGLPLKPGWYSADVDKITQEVSKPKPNIPSGINQVVYFRVPDGSDEGREVKHWFSSKAMGMAVPFILAKRNQPMPTDVSDLETIDFDTDELVGKKICKIHVINDTYNGMITNKIDGFLPYDASTDTTF